MDYRQPLMTYEHQWSPYISRHHKLPYEMKIIEIGPVTERCPHVLVPDAITVTEPVGWTWNRTTPHAPVPDAITVNEPVGWTWDRTTPHAPVLDAITTTLQVGWTWERIVESFRGHDGNATRQKMFVARDRSDKMTEIVNCIQSA
ncbi:hypothetical protein AVEN_4084-1 [Araneus ventricosus]|uniref:Uncharacterized protein n=1 Tax=Araneus ventricosus TaxID=182803 RepID=A0A4Y2IVJ3_ARAVE|nr:hypothetical protein AVEN_4084-1 [Araneus ventricosus]